MADTERCTGCGAAFPEGSADGKCPKCSAEDAAASVTACPYCGASIPGTDRICPSCGQGLEAASPEEPTGMYCEWEDRNLGLFRRYWKTWWRSILHPDDFFKRLPRTSDKWASMNYAVMTSLQTWAPITLFGVIAGICLWIMVPPDDQVSWIGPAVLFGSLGFPVLIYPLTIIGVYITTIVYHVSAILCGGHGTFADSLRIVAYAWGANVLNVIPQIGSLLSLVAHLLLYTYGFKHLHRVSMGRAILMFLLPAIALILIVGGSLAAFLIWYASIS